MLLLRDNSLLELSLDGLSPDLVINDLNMMDRFGRSSQNVQSLSIGNIRQCGSETRKALTFLVITILSSNNSTPTKLRLFNFGFELEDGLRILEILLEKNFRGLKELCLGENPELFHEESPCVTQIL